MIFNCFPPLQVSFFEQPRPLEIWGWRARPSLWQTLLLGLWWSGTWSWQFSIFGIESTEMPSNQYKFIDIYFPKGISLKKNGLFLGSSARLVVPFPLVFPKPLEKSKQINVDQHEQEMYSGRNIFSLLRFSWMSFLIVFALVIDWSFTCMKRNNFLSPRTVLPVQHGEKILVMLASH